VRPAKLDQLLQDMYEMEVVRSESLGLVFLVPGWSFGSRALFIALAHVINVPAVAVARIGSAMSELLRGRGLR
jgi:hypothetical protein